VNGNIFQDNLGNAVNLGHPQHYIIGDGPLYPAGVEGITYQVEIKNNVIRSSSLGFAQEEYISGFFTDSVMITHNDLQDSPYGAIVNGWWWGDAGIPPSTVIKNNTISYNKIVNTGTVLDEDGGAIYVLGVQPGSVISYNYIVNGTRGIYTDDGSQYWYVHHNVVEDPRSSWMNIWTPRTQNEHFDSNYTTMDNAYNKGTNIRVTNTSVQASAPPWDRPSRTIINSAGLEPAWQYLLITPGTTKYEAEKAVLVGGTGFACNQTGYSDTGFVTGYSTRGAAATFTISVASQGDYQINLRYSAGRGATETVSLYVNGVILSQLSLPSTATDWNVWADKTQTVSLRSGLNTIAIKDDTGDTGWVNLDYINIEPAR